MRIDVLTVSDRAADGAYEDLTGPAIAEMVRSWGEIVGQQLTVEDDQSLIEQALRAWCDQDQPPDVVLTNGGTGLGPRDVTPEATLAVVDRTIPGIGELMRRRSFEVTPLAALSRQSAGQCRTTIIVNLPGSPKGALECLEVLPEVLRHAVKVVRGGTH